MPLQLPYEGNSKGLYISSDFCHSPLMMANHQSMLPDVVMSEPSARRPKNFYEKLLHTASSRSAKEVALARLKAKKQRIQVTRRQMQKRLREAVKRLKDKDEELEEVKLEIKAVQDRAVADEESDSD
jgi:septin family protein